MQVEVWSDVVCPWCAIGRARLQQALEQFPHADEVEVTWRSFELDPSRPAAPEGDYVGMLATKYRTSRAQAQAMIDRMTAAGAEEGIAFDFVNARPGNTFDAHRVLHLARDRGLGEEVKAAFLHGYHSAGAAIADHGTLVRLASDAGLDADEVRDVLGGDRYAQEVRAEEQEARDLGVQGVPFFVLDRRYGVSGAQPAEVLLRALEQAHEDATTGAARPDAGSAGPHEHDHAPGEACTDGACAV